MQKKTKDSSSLTAITKAPFEVFPAIGAPKPTQTGRKKQEYVHVRPLLIPKMVDDYNYFMNGVDIADQLRARFTTEQQTSRTWMPLFYYLLDTAICNAYILSEHYRKSRPLYDPTKRVRGTH
jgi:Transposase IS4